MWSGSNAGCKIFDLENLMVRFEDVLAESPKIEPLVMSTPDCPIVEIEAVYVNVGSQ
jgi:hypothetical protein